ncbi:hypothetical protein V6K52_10440 [Knoellia sp. S7-12]|uniref:hypothetical protein n=1 Tax=Knoellia sp. S7-12 TaxID=3126698 RepID=UPI003368696C
MTSAAPSRPRPRGSLIVFVVLVAMWAAWALWFTLAPSTNPGGQCEGLGFGCTLTPNDLAAFAGIIILAPGTFLLVALTLAVRATRIGRGSPRTVWDVVLAVLLLAAGALFVIGNLVGSF